MNNLLDRDKKTYKIYRFILAIFLLTLLFKNVHANTDCSNTQATGVPEIECTTLVYLYQQNQGDKWIENKNWNTVTPISEWFGIRIEEGHIIAIDLAGNNLQGSLINEFANFSKLSLLSLSNNNLEGQIPDSLGNVRSLEELYLDENNLNGHLPASIGNLSHLVWLKANNNQLSGSIPAELSNLSQLKHLILKFNRFTGEIPASLGKLSQLKMLSIDNNSLEGSIPASLGDLSNLEFLLLFSNKLTGSLPPELGKLNKLDFFDIDINQISGSIPPEFGNMSSLTRLDIDFNKVSGTIPPELGKLVKLTDLYMRNNQLEGGIPESFSNLANLQKFFIEENKLTGTIPEFLFKLPNLRWLYLQSNRFSGNLPANLGESPFLERLLLQKNQLEGAIPDNIINLQALKKLDLSYNMLYSNNPTTVNFIKSIQADWNQTQTLKLTDIHPTAATFDSITVQWTSNLYQPKSGFYRIWLSNTPDGGFVSQGTTADLKSNSYTLTHLKPGTTYFLRISTYVPVTERQINTLVASSDTVILTTPADPNEIKPVCFAISSATYRGQTITFEQGNETLYLSMQEPEGTEQHILELGITRSAANAGDASVAYAVLNGSAENHEDYLIEADSGTLAFIGTEVEKKLSIKILGDSTVEEFEEVFRIRLSDPKSLVNPENINSLCAAQSDNLEITFAPSDYPPKMDAETWILLEVGDNYGGFIEGGSLPFKIVEPPNPEIVQIHQYDGGSFLELQAIAPGITHFTLADSELPENKLYYEVFAGIKTVKEIIAQSPPFNRVYDINTLGKVNLVYPMVPPESDDWLEERHLFFFLMVDGKLFQVQDQKVCTGSEPETCQIHYFLTEFNPVDPFLAYRAPSWTMDLKPELSNVSGFDLTKLDFSHNGLNWRNLQIMVFEGFAYSADAFLGNPETLLESLVWTWYPITIQ